MVKEQEVLPWGYASYAKYMAGLQVRYRMNNITFQQFWDKQEGKCSGCEKDFAHPWIKDMNKFGIEPQVDHKHTGREMQGGGNKCELIDVRGLLCRRCNCFLGTCKDNEQQLLNLASYLNRYEALRAR